MAEVKKVVFNDENATNSTSIKKKYKSRRLHEAHLFLSAISLDGRCDLEKYNAHRNERSFVAEKLDLEKCIQRDPSLELIIHNAATVEAKKRPPLNHSVSVTTSVNVEGEIRQRSKGTILETSLTHDGVKREILRSKSTMETAKDYMQNVLHVWKPSRSGNSQKHVYGKRIVFVSQHQVPYQSFSIIPYTQSNTPVNSNFHATNTQNIVSGEFIENINMGDGKTEVSYGHLLVPESSKNRKSLQNEEVTETDPSGLDYLIDDPELTSGKHRIVLPLPSCMLSIIQYAKPSQVKKDINERFKEKFPQVTITLTKLRSLKSELQEIGTKLSLDAAVLACAYVYFEKVVLKTRITKHNRKYIAGACLLLAIKYGDDILSKSTQRCIEVITDQFRLSTKELLSCELQVLILLEFALELSLNEVTPIYKRLVPVNI